MARVQSHETIARVRAHLLHILYELGHEDHQFRLRFKGQYLRDAYTIEDYAIVENAIIKMVPLSRREEVRKICCLPKGRHSEGQHEIRLICAQNYSSRRCFLEPPRSPFGRLAPLEAMHFHCIH